METSSSVGKNVNSCSYYGKQHRGSSKNKNSYPNPAIPVLGIYPDKSIIQKDTCNPMFIAVLFTQQPRQGNNRNVQGQMNG